MSTIVAISTSPGVGGIGIVRMSGENCFDVLDKIFVPKNKNEIKGYTMKYGNIIEDNNIIDEVLVSYFISPKSYTTENMCEINSHGGLVIMNKILEICIKNGAQLAEPGEFTKRAFLNGRIDLSQAEAVIDIINSKTEKESQVALKQLEGGLSKKIQNIRRKTLSILSDIEANIDYPEYDVEETSKSNVEQFLGEIDILLNQLEKNFLNSKIIREGIKVSIIGKPNVGKSSLLNILLNEERAIVTDIEGTTRDTIEEMISIEGIPIKIIDTAGIRNSEDKVEQIGIDKSIKAIQDSDIVLALFDVSREFDEKDEEICNLIKEKNAIIILNKIDLETKINIEKLKQINKKIIEISTENYIGIDNIYDEISDICKLKEIVIDDEIMVINSRHKNIIFYAHENVKIAKNAINNNMPIDIISIQLKNIIEELGKITGETVTDDLLDEIFSKFCLGK